MDYETSVFINCPFDEEYREMMQALVFAVHDCGFVARSALEGSDSSEARIVKIQAIIEICKYGIHDVSRTNPSAESGLPRFNMPLELGLFLGAKRYGGPKQRQKNCLVLDTEKYRYQQFMSDISGQDISAHDGEPALAIRRVRNWLRNATTGSGTVIPGGEMMGDRFEEFNELLPAICSEAGQDYEGLIFNDFTTLLVAWLEENPWG